MDRFWRRSHYNLHRTLEPYLINCQAPLDLLLFSWAELVAGTLWGCYEAVLAPVLSLSVPLGFHSLVLAMVDATRDAFDNIGASLRDVVGTVVVLLVAVA